MSPTVQTFAALAIVAGAVAWLIARVIAKRKNPGCGSDCGAVSPEVKKLQAHLKRRH